MSGRCSQGNVQFETLHIVVSNAGFSGMLRSTKLIHDQWNKVIGVNLTGQSLCAREAVANARDGGVVTDDLCGCRQARLHEFRPSEHPAGPVTRTTISVPKGGLVQMMRSVAHDVAPLSIRLIGIAPGAIRTPINRAAWGTNEATNA